MTLDAILHILTHSKAEDWYRIPCGALGCGPSYYYRFEEMPRGPGQSGNRLVTGSHTSVATYRQDLSITMAWGMSTGKDCDRNDVWTDTYPDPRPDPCFLLDLFYSGSLVFRTSYCMEGACKVPLADASLQVPQRYADVICKLNEMEGACDEIVAAASAKPGYATALHQRGTTAAERAFEETMKKSGITTVDAPWPV